MITFLLDPRYWLVLVNLLGVILLYRHLCLSQPSGDLVRVRLLSSDDEERKPKHPEDRENLVNELGNLLELLKREKALPIDLQDIEDIKKLLSQLKTGRGSIS